MRRVDSKCGQSWAYSPTSDTGPQRWSSPVDRTDVLAVAIPASLALVHARRPSCSSGVYGDDSYHTHLISPSSVRTARVARVSRDSGIAIGRTPWTKIASEMQTNPAPSAYRPQSSGGRPGAPTPCPSAGFIAVRIRL